MRFSDMTDYLALRRLVNNAGEVARFRRNRDVEAELEVRLRSRPPLFLRGGRSDFHMFHRIFLRDEYRLRGLRPGRLSCVVDLGGNVGLFSARVAPEADRVVVCEPVPFNFSQLERNTGAFENVVAVPAAVAGESGTLRIFSPREEKRSGAFSAHLDPESGDGSVACEAKAVTLDELFAQEGITHCDLLKLDVEGSEYGVLATLSDTGWECIQRIHGEYHNVEPKTPENRWDYLEGLLRTRGFRVEALPHRRKENHGMFFAWRESES